MLREIHEEQNKKVTRIDDKWQKEWKVMGLGGEVSANERTMVKVRTDEHDHNSGDIS